MGEKMNEFDSNKCGECADYLRDCICEDADKLNDLENLARFIEGSYPKIWAGFISEYRTEYRELRPEEIGEYLENQNIEFQGFLNDLDDLENDLNNN
jgi:hypothetical protein